ncbi:MAG: hemerythrin domain-containing protein [Armatimonadetes bacterium]|nr:hemerythrin domain-containing protein [Armatimonadota bacterium]
MYATQQLRDEHEGIKVVLSVLEHLATQQERGQAVNTGHLDEIVDFLRTFADKCHHGKEEDLLFPALAQAGIPVEGGPIGMMLQEHTLGRGYIQGMVDALAQMKAGRDAGSEFARNALGYVELLRSHIEKENQVLFAIAEHHLPEAEHVRLAAGFDQVEQERIGPGVHERYHEMIHALRDAYLAGVA